VKRRNISEEISAGDARNWEKNGGRAKGKGHGAKREGEIYSYSAAEFLRNGEKSMK